MTLEQKIREAIPELGYDIKEVDDCIEYVVYEKPIQLNHVLGYVLDVLDYSITSDVVHEIILDWKLESNLLSDQSEELKNFIDELA